MLGRCFVTLDREVPTSIDTTLSTVTALVTSAPGGTVMPRAAFVMTPATPSDCSPLEVWNCLTAASVPPSKEPSSWHAHTAFLRTAFARLGPHWQARLLTFAHRRLPWLQTLDARPPLRLSLLGVELARLIANSEGADLLSPLHAA